MFGLSDWFYGNHVFPLLVVDKDETKGNLNSV